MIKTDRENLLLYELNERIDVRKFCCEDDEVNDYFYNKALTNNLKLISKTYVVNNKNNNDVVGIFTLSASLLKLTGKEQYGISRVPTILLGRIGIDNKYRKQNLGQFLLEQAIGICEAVKKLIGCRLLITESTSGSKTLTYFKNLGFKYETTDKRSGKIFEVLSFDLF